MPPEHWGDSMRLIALAAALACLSSAAFAADAPPPPYGAPITLEQAKVVVAAAQAEARKRGITIAVAVVDSGGTLVIAERMTGASLASAQTMLLKARSAILWQRSTGSWLPVIEASHGAQITYPDLYAGNGGEPIVAGGRMIGAVGIGGSGPNEADISRLAAAALK